MKVLLHYNIKSAKKRSKCAFINLHYEREEFVKENLHVMKLT